MLAGGHSLVATARDPGRLADLAARYSNQIRTLKLDVTGSQAARDAVESAFDSFGRLGVLVHYAGHGNVGPVEDTSLEGIRAQVETNLFGVINATKAAIPFLREQGSGHFIQISSVGGRVGAMGRAACSAAKWGVEGFSEALAEEMAPLGVKVTVIEPGGFRTDFAGPSSTISGGRPEYDATAGAAARFQRGYRGNQPGDPARAAAVIIGIAALDEPPLRLLLGSDAVRTVEQADLAKLEADKLWRKLSLSTDFAEKLYD